GLGDSARHPLGATGARHDRPADLRQAEARFRRADADVARECKLHAPSEAEAVDGSDDRLIDREALGESAKGGGAASELVLPAGGSDEVHAGRKRLVAYAGEDCDAQFRVVAEVL